jgi:hypothetical protein
LPGPSPQEVAWRVAEAEAAVVMGTVNTAVARLVAAVRELLAAEGWVGPGIQSPEHWLCWKAGVSRFRAEGLVRIARRAGEIPACWALFAQGRLGEDAMVRIARRVPAARDTEIAELAPTLLIAQLDRVLRSLPELPDGSRERAVPERVLRLRDGRDGWLRGQFCLPADEGAILRLGLTAARDAEFRDRHDLTPHSDLTPDTPLPAGSDGGPVVPGVSWADGLVRMASEAADALDPTLARTGHRGERNHTVLHIDVDPDGTCGPAQLEHGPVIPDNIARFLTCDSKIQVMTYRLGQLIGIHPTERTANRSMRRYLARRDQGCTHPLCTQQLWLHAHHLVHWEHGGLTTPDNLLSLCPRHHRALHTGEFTIDGNPETGTLSFRDRWGQPITAPKPRPPDPPQAGPPDTGPPDTGPPAPSGGPPRDGPPRPSPFTQPPFTPPLAERLQSNSFTWN